MNFITLKRKTLFPALVSLSIALCMGNSSCQKENDPLPPAVVDSLKENAPLRLHSIHYDLSGNVVDEGYASFQVDDANHQIRLYEDNPITASFFDRLMQTRQFNKEGYLQEANNHAGVSDTADSKMSFFRNGTALYKSFNDGWLGPWSNVNIAFKETSTAVSLIETSRSKPPFFDSVYSEFVFLKNKPEECVSVVTKRYTDYFPTPQTIIKNALLEYNSEGNLLRRKDEEDEISITYDNYANNLRDFFHIGLLGKDFNYLDPEAVDAPLSISAPLAIDMDVVRSPVLKLQRHLAIFKYKKQLKTVVHKYKSDGVAKQDTFDFSNTYDGKGRLLKMIITFNGSQKVQELSIEYQQ